MKFAIDDLRKLWRPDSDSSGEDNGQITIVGGSELFTGAPIMSAIAASRLVDMVFLSTPEQDKDVVSNVALFSKIRSLIWVPRQDIDLYIEKSDAVLMGPGLMRYRDSLPEGEYDDAGTETRSMTKYLLQRHPNKKWVIDGGSLQTMKVDWIPKGSILTPNSKELAMLTDGSAKDLAHKCQCIVVSKGPTSYVTDGKTTYEITGGNSGLTKGGTGDVLAGIIVGLVTKNDSLLAAAAGTYLIKKTAEYLEEKVGLNFNADDVAQNVFGVFKRLG